MSAHSIVNLKEEVEDSLGGSRARTSTLSTTIAGGPNESARQIDSMIGAAELEVGGAGRLLHVPQRLVPGW